MASMTTRWDRGYSVGFGCIFWMIPVGVMYLFGNASPYIASYLTYYHPNAISPIQQKEIYQMYLSQLNYLYLAFIGISTISLAVGGSIEVYLGPLRTMIIASTLSFGYGLCCFSLLLTKIYPKYGLLFLLIPYGFMYSSGNGISYGIPLVVIMRWFPNNKGIACGLINSGIGIGPLILDNIQTWLVNPDNIPLNTNIGYIQYPQIIDRIPTMFLWINLMMIALQIIGFILIVNPSWYLSEFQLLSNTEDNRNVSQSQYEYDRLSLSLKEALRTKLFWMLLIHNFFYLFLLTFMTTQWKIFGMDYLEITDDSFLALTGSINGFCNALGRLLWGVLYEKVFHSSYKLTMIVQNMIICVMLFTLPICKYSVDTMYFIWMLILWFCIGGLFGFYPAAISQIFGSKYSGTLFGSVISIEGFSAFIFAVFSQNIYNWFGGWILYCIMLGIVSILCVIMTLLANTNIDKSKYLRSRITMKPTTNYESIHAIH